MSLKSAFWTVTGASFLFLAAGCQDQGLSLDVQAGRPFKTLVKTELLSEGTGLLPDQGNLATEILWSMEFSAPRDGLRQVRITSDSASMKGKAQGVTLRPDIFESAVKEIDLRLSVNPQGRTLSWSEDLDQLKAKGLDQAVASVTATFRAMGPLGVVLPKGPLKKNAPYRFEADLAPVLNLSSPDEEGVISTFTLYEGDEKVGKRSAAKLSWTTETKILRTVAIQGQEAVVEAKGTSRGVSWMDRRTGLCLKSEWTSENTIALPGSSGQVIQKEKGSSVLESSPE